MTLDPPRSTTFAGASRLRWSQTARLVEAAQDGDREAFGALVEQFERTVYAIALRRLGHVSEALELTQDVFLHAMRVLPQLRDPERFAGWLKQMTHRMAINRATRRVPPSPIDDEVLQSIGETDRESPVDTLIARERSDRLYGALEGLKPLDRDTLMDFYIRGESLVEIATRLDVPIGTVKRRLHTARLRLRRALEDASEDPYEWVDSPAEEDAEMEFELLSA
jgi:RNA polymerase sigma-70 factor (ECF subfamily)